MNKWSKFNLHGQYQPYIDRGVLRFPISCTQILESVKHSCYYTKENALHYGLHFADPFSFKEANCAPGLKIQ